MKKSEFLKKYGDKPLVSVDVETRNVTIQNNYDLLLKQVNNKGFSICYDIESEKVVKIVLVNNVLKVAKKDELLYSLPFYDHDIDYLTGCVMIFVGIIMLMLSLGESLEYLLIIIPILITGALFIRKGIKSDPINRELRKIRRAIHQASNTTHPYEEISIFDGIFTKQRIIENESYLYDKSIIIFSDSWKNEEA